MPLSTLPLAYWTHNLSPFLIEFSPGIGLRYYGLGYVLSFLGSAWMLEHYARKGRSPLAKEKVWDLMLYLIAGVMIGGRLGSFFLYHPQDLWEDPLSVFRVWEGGMASHGGFAGVMIALAVFARRHGLSFLELGDRIVTVAPFGLLLVRIANFINGELWGRISVVPWAVIFPASGAPDPRHPSQLYEAFAEGLILLCYLQGRFWSGRDWQARPGRLAGEFLVGYSLARMVCEQFREPDAALIAGMSRGTFYSIFLIAFGLYLILRRPNRLESKP